VARALRGFEFQGAPSFGVLKGGAFIDLLRVRNHIEQVVQISVDLEVAAPACIPSALPNIARLIVLLSGWPRLCWISHLWVARPSVLEGRGFVGVILNRARETLSFEQDELSCFG